MSRYWILITVALLAAVPTAFAGLPEWGEPWQQTPKLGVREAQDRQLLNAATVQLSERRTQITHRDVYLVGGSGAFADFETSVHYVGDSFKRGDGWIIRPGGKIRGVEKDALSHRLALTEALYSDAKVAEWSLENIEVGSVLLFEYAIALPYRVGTSRFYAQSSEWDVDSSVVEFQLPDGWRVALSPQGVPDGRCEIRAQAAGVGPVPAWTEKPYQGSYASSAAHIVYRVYESAGPDTPQSWAEVSRDMAEQWGELKDGIGTLQYAAVNQPDLAAALASYERDFRYVAIELGTGSYIPHLPRDVLAVRYGDCKDLSFFLRSALTEAGIEVYPVLTKVPATDPFVPDYPYPFQFNHCITVVVRDGDTLYYDPTTRGYDLGQLPAGEHGAYALWLKPGSELTTLPKTSSGLPQRRVLRGRLGADGTLTGTLEVGFDHLGRKLAAIIPNQDEFKKQIRSLLRSDVAADFGTLVLDEQQRTATLEVQLRNYVRVVGPSLYCRPYPFAAGEDSVAGEFPAGYFCDADHPAVTVVDLQLPGGFTMRSDTTSVLDSEIGAARFALQCTGDSLHAEWSREFHRRHFPREARPLLNEFLRTTYRQRGMLMKLAH